MRVMREKENEKEKEKKVALRRFFWPHVPQNSTPYSNVSSRRSRPGGAGAPGFTHGAFSSFYITIFSEH
ncbi:unnamed protein product [Lupinus luteus]|uniref:Uncharacterized protein n=1 Tax=Lupinus luteus TaxID=3873 RepID=A0AAV1XNN3_LUPLU